MEVNKQVKGREEEN